MIEDPEDEKIADEYDPLEQDISDEIETILVDIGLEDDELEEENT